MMKPNKIIQEVFGGKSRKEVDINTNATTPNLIRKSLGLPPKEDEIEHTLYVDNKEVLKIYGR